MFDFAGDIDQAMKIILAYTGRVKFFGVSITEVMVMVLALPWAIYAVQGLIKLFSPVPVDFDPITGSIYDDAWHEERDNLALENYKKGYYDPESSGAIKRYRERLSRVRRINRK